MHHYSRQPDIFAIQVVLLTSFYCPRVSFLLPCDNRLNHVTDFYVEIPVLFKRNVLQFPQIFPPYSSKHVTCETTEAVFCTLPLALLFRPAVEKPLLFDCNTAHSRIYVCVSVDCATYVLHKICCQKFPNHSLNTRLTPPPHIML